MVNSLKTTREAFLASLRERNVNASPTKTSPYGVTLEARRPRGVSLRELGGWHSGDFELQDEGSQLIACACRQLDGPQAATSPLIIDLCAGRGGKTLALAAMYPSGRIYAYDTDHTRLDDIEV